jgi:hypothetical protein
MSNRALAAIALVGAIGCSEADPAAAPVSPATESETAWVEIGSTLFELELALDPQTRMRGLGGRRRIPPNGGMLFVSPVAQPQAMVMRDCPIPIDVAFLDAAGRIVSMHSMQPEPPRRPGETPSAYEGRLPRYASGVAAAFAVETAGGRLAELGVSVGDALVFNAPEMLERARDAGL